MSTVLHPELLIRLAVSLSGICAAAPGPLRPYAGRFVVPGGFVFAQSNSSGASPLLRVGFYDVGLSGICADAPGHLRPYAVRFVVSGGFVFAQSKSSGASPLLRAGFYDVGLSGICADAPGHLRPYAGRFVVSGGFVFAQSNSSGASGAPPGVEDDEGFHTGQTRARAAIS